MKKWVLVLVSSLCFQAVAELRIWRDKKGNAIEAEFMTMSAGKVVLKSAEGKVLKIDPSGLCAQDQEWLKNSIPPDLDISFSKKQDRRKHGYSYSSEVFMEGSIEVKKTNREPYAREVKLVFMMIGEDQRYREYVTLDRVEGKFDFKNQKTFSLEGKRFRMWEDNYDNSYGTDYVGYLAVVLDDEGHVIEKKSSRNEFEEHSEKMLEFKTGERFSRTFQKTNR